ncbi:ankyrin-2 isoform X4 [Neocloeon triangulifer]|uniref:ankyrin-2 isoform X4 n=1 Tax=Neocloeon triangulifer TaxID=2078957 RepID=UPI00286ED36D|nr:ankyrin-2 isoform X4 [Neocloeon triangulifer]
MPVDEEESIVDAVLKVQLGSNGGVEPVPAPRVNGNSKLDERDEEDEEKNAENERQLQQQQTDGNTAFLRAARAGNLDKVLEYLKSNIDINTSNANGLNALHLASKDGHVHVVTELLSRGATVDAATKKGNTALHIASLAGQEEVVKILVHHGASVNVQSQNGFTPLYMAAQENHDNVVKFLLANSANQSLATEDGFTPLAVAMQQGHDKVVAVLLENDTRGKVRLPALHIAAKKDDCKAAALLLQNDHNPDVTSKSGFTPLHIAAHYGNESIANLLLQRNADVNYSAKHNITPLHVAAKWGKTNMVSLLIEKGANIEAKTRDGLTPLHCAARSGHEQVVDMLLERSAPISAKTKNGLAPLHMASQGDHVDAARILLYHKAPVDEVTVDYLTALHVAAHCGHVRVAKLLLDRKADPNARALNGFTPLHIACKKNRIKVVELLLKHGASIEATTESGLTPLHVASFMGCMNIVIYLIQHEANPDVPTVRGETPLHLAARANQTDIIRILLRNGAQVDARAREQQTPLHIASRLGNVDIVMLLLQHGAAVDATTKDMYTALHIAAKEGQEEVASVLLENGASLTSTTKKGFTPLHLAAKYGNMKVAKLLLQRDAPVDAQGKNGVTPLHVASHYDHQNVALLLLDKGASPHATAKNGHTPLHIAARKNQMDIATTLLEYGAKANSESKAGFTPLHLSSQEGHTDMSTLLIEHQADPNHKSKNGLAPLHLCAQEDRVNVAAILAKNEAEVDAKTKAGYTPLHVASHFGQLNMVRFLLQHGVDVNSSTSAGYTPLHQAAQQGHTLIINLLLEHKATPNAVTNQGQTALCIAQKLGYISVVETLKVVTETTITTTTTTIVEEKYRVMAPETMQETFMSDSEDEGGDDVMESTVYGKPTHAQHVYLPYYEGQMLLSCEDTVLGDQPYRYLTVDEMKSLGDDSLPIDVTRDERADNRDSIAPVTVHDDSLSPTHKEHYSAVNYAPDNVDIAKHPVSVGFLVSFMVDARGGAMRGCRHSGVRVIVPPRKAAMPMRVTCRYLKKDKLTHPPPLMEGEALSSRILELGPVGAKFLGPVIIEVPHFGSLRGKEREIVILRSDNGETWREHTLEASEEAIQEVLQESFDGEDLTQLEDMNTNRITRILTTEFPQYFAIVSRVRQEVHAIGPEGGMVSSSVVPQVQAVFPQGALTKKIKVGLQAQPIAAELVAKMLGNRVAVSPIVTVEPRRRKFHKPITLTIPVPQAANKGMINQYSGEAPTLRLLCSITGGTTRAQWEDVTGSTPLTFVNDCVSFTTTVSARFWLMDCRNISEATRMATELYKEAIHVPFMAKFVVFAKRVDLLEARLRIFCMTDDKEDKTLEHQEHFSEMAKSRDVEVLEGKTQWVEFNGNLVPVTKSGEQLQLGFHAFKENRLPFTVRVKDPHADTVGRILFMREPKVPKGEQQQTPICVLNIVLPDNFAPHEADLIEKKFTLTRETFTHSESIHRADLRLSDICNLLGRDWVPLANELGVQQSEISLIQAEYPESVPQQGMVMLRLWMQNNSNRATGNTLEKALNKIGRQDIVQQCMFNVELVTDEMERAVAKVQLDQSGFDNLKEELGPSRDTSMRRNVSLDASYDEQDLMRDSESVEELNASETIVTVKEDKRPKDDLIEKIVEKHDVNETKYVAEEKDYVEEAESRSQQQADDHLRQEISDEFVRIDKLNQSEEVSRVSKTPPPSPAEFKEETVSSTPKLGQQDFPERETRVVRQEHSEYTSPDGTHTVTHTTITTSVTQGAEPSASEAALFAETETWRSETLTDVTTPAQDAGVEGNSSVQEHKSIPGEKKSKSGIVNPTQISYQGQRIELPKSVKAHDSVKTKSTEEEIPSYVDRKQFWENVTGTTKSLIGPKQYQKGKLISEEESKKEMEIRKEAEESCVKTRQKTQRIEKDIMKEFSDDFLRQQEESSPEHKILGTKQKFNGKLTEESIVSRQIHTEIFTTEISENIESLIPEDKPISPLQAIEDVNEPMPDPAFATVKEKIGEFEKKLSPDSKPLFPAEQEYQPPIKQSSEHQAKICAESLISDIEDTIKKSPIVNISTDEIFRSFQTNQEIEDKQITSASKNIVTEADGNLDKKLETFKKSEKIDHVHEIQHTDSSSKVKSATHKLETDILSKASTGMAIYQEAVVQSTKKSDEIETQVLEQSKTSEKSQIHFNIDGEHTLMKDDATISEVATKATASIPAQFTTEISTSTSPDESVAIKRRDNELNKIDNDKAEHVRAEKQDAIHEHVKDISERVKSGSSLTKLEFSSESECMMRITEKATQSSKDKKEDMKMSVAKTESGKRDELSTLSETLTLAMDSDVSLNRLNQLSKEEVKEIKKSEMVSYETTIETSGTSKLMSEEDTSQKLVQQRNEMAVFGKEIFESETVSFKSEILTKVSEKSNFDQTDQTSQISNTQEDKELVREVISKDVQHAYKEEKSVRAEEANKGQIIIDKVTKDSVMERDTDMEVLERIVQSPLQSEIPLTVTSAFKITEKSSSHEVTIPKAKTAEIEVEKAIAEVRESLGAAQESLIESQFKSSTEEKKRSPSEFEFKVCQFEKNEIAESKSSDDEKNIFSGQEETSSTQENKKPDRSSSSGESFKHDENFKSRPCSSDVEGLIVGAATSSEYESALTSQDTSQRSATSQEYITAVSSISSNKSYSSESSGQQIEVHSDASETLVPSAMELETDLEDNLPNEDLDLGHDNDLQRPLGSAYQVLHETKSSESDDSYIEDFKDSPVKEKRASDQSRMKRSLEMTFHPEPKTILTDSPVSEITTTEEKERLFSSIDDTVSIISTSVSSASELDQRTVMENLASQTISQQFTDMASSIERLDDLSSLNSSYGISPPRQENTFENKQPPQECEKYTETTAVSSSEKDVSCSVTIMSSSSVEKCVATQITSIQDHTGSKINDQPEFLKEEEILDQKINFQKEQKDDDEKDIDEADVELEIPADEEGYELREDEVLEEHKNFSQTLIDGVKNIVERPKTPEPDADKFHVKEKNFEARKTPPEVPHFPSQGISSTCLPPTILEDDDAEKKIEAMNNVKIVEFTEVADIPDITVTQHQTPVAKKKFEYPESASDESVLSSSNKKEIRVEKNFTENQSTTEASDISPDEEAVILTKDDIISDISLAKESKNDQADKSPESDGTDSFELLEKAEGEKEPEKKQSDEEDEFLIIEELADEADESACIASIPQAIPRESKIPIPRRKSTKQDDDLLVSSPPPTSTRLTEIKFYPDDEKCDMPFQLEGTSFQPQNVETYKKDVEEGKKWIEQQFKGEYEDFEQRGRLEDIEEKEETEQSHASSKVGSMGSYKDSFSSTPEYDVLAGKRYFSKSSEHDDVSMGSLQEFEKLEREIALRQSSGSQDSINGGSFQRRYLGSRTGQGDDMSVSSLKEFERLEIACIQAETIEIKAKEEEAMLSEIDEGHESQVSESESCETISEAGKESDSDDYENRMFEIDEIIKQAQFNVESFESKKGEAHGKGTKKEQIPSAKHATICKEYVLQYECENQEVNPMTMSTDSIESLQAKVEQKKMLVSTDSLELDTPKIPKSQSADSIEEELKGEKSKSSSSGRREDSQEAGVSDLMLCSTDSLEPTSSTATHATYQYETDSVMSSSFTSGGSATMVSSTENVDFDVGQLSEEQLTEAFKAGGFEKGDVPAQFLLKNNESWTYVTEVIEGDGAGRSQMIESVPEPIDPRQYSAEVSHMTYITRHISSQSSKPSSSETSTITTIRTGLTSVSEGGNQSEGGVTVEEMLRDPTKQSGVATKENK